MAHLQIPADDRQAIEGIIAGQVAAWNKGDAVAFSAHVLDDCVFTNTVGMVAVGPAGFLAQHEHIFATIYKGTRLTQTVTHLRLLRPDVAIVDSDTEVAGSSWFPPGAWAPGGTLHSRLEQVMVKNDGAWGITSFHNVFVSRTN